MGFEKWVSVSGQTYTRKIDYQVLSALSGFGQSAYKMAADIRLLASMKQVGIMFPIKISRSELSNDVIDRGAIR